MGTLAAAVLASFLLGSLVAERVGPKVAVLAVGGAVAVSPVLYYLFILPGMAHGLTYALAAAGLVAADRAARRPSVRTWATVGLAVGLLALVRPQAAAFALVMIPVAARDLWRGRAKRPLFFAAATAAAFVAFLPQMLAWKVIYGHWFTQNQELAQWAEQAGVSQRVLFRMSSWFDPRSLHLRDTLFAADRGLFSWHPVLLLGMLGLPFAVRRFGLLPVGGLLVFAATAWFNGSVATYRAGDSFGARRFDLVVPFAALSFAVLLETARRRPLVVPALVLAGAALVEHGPHRALPAPRAGRGGRSRTGGRLAGRPGRGCGRRADGQGVRSLRPGLRLQRLRGRVHVLQPRRGRLLRPVPAPRCATSRAGGRSL